MAKNGDDQDDAQAGPVNPKADAAVSIIAICLFVGSGFLAFSWVGVFVSLMILLSVYEWVPGLIDRWRTS